MRAKFGGQGFGNVRGPAGGEVEGLRIDESREATHISELIFGRGDPFDEVEQHPSMAVEYIWDECEPNPLHFGRGVFLELYPLDDLEEEGLLFQGLDEEVEETVDEDDDEDEEKGSEDSDKYYDEGDD
jgi:hypothetical protein